MRGRRNKDDIRQPARGHLSLYNAALEFAPSNDSIRQLTQAHTMNSSSTKMASTTPANMLTELVTAAIRAPSGDNCQPWQFRTNDSGAILVDILPERAKSFFDFQHRATFLSVGAVLENMRIQAGYQGYELNFDYPSGEQPGKAAAIVAGANKSAAQVGPEKHQAMLNRTVNRRPFFRRCPSTEKLSALTTDPIPETQTHIYRDRDEIRTWARLIYLADRIRFSHPVIHREVFGKILLNRKEIEQTRMGLEFDRLGIGPGSAGILKLLKPWERMQRLSRFGADSALSNQSRLLALSSGAMVLVSVADNTAKSWMFGGQQVQRLWVTAHELGLCTHPMTVALYLSQRYREQGMKDFLPGHEPWLKEISTTLDQLLNGRIGIMIFRLGSAMKMSGPAVRLPLERFLPNSA